MAHRKFNLLRLAILLGIVLAAVSNVALPSSLRLYVFDCGMLNYTNADAYQLKRQEVANTDMSIACFLIAHPKGTLMWDVGAIPDKQLETHRLSRAASFCPAGLDRTRCHDNQALEAAVDRGGIFAFKHQLSVAVALSLGSHR
jgi:hypothetical protein